MVRGVIYMYTSPSGKSYIGQTIDETKRRQFWFSSRYDYAGDKINKARAKYGRDAFTYTVLFSHTYSNKEEAIKMLDTLEMFYIDLYDTYKHGYNCDKGGRCHPGLKVSKETRKKIGEGTKRWASTTEGKAKLSEAQRRRTDRQKGYRIEKNYKAIVQLTMDGQFIKEHSSIRDAAEYLDAKDKSLRANISATCRGKRESAVGYRWLFKDDYYTYFLREGQKRVPENVQKIINAIERLKAPKIKKTKKKKTYKRKEGPKINRFAQQIGQYGSDLNLIRVWRNGLEAANTLNINSANIYRSARTLGMYMGYYWRKYDGQQNILPKPKKVSIRTYSEACKKVVQKDLYGNIVATYNSIGEACTDLKVPNRTSLSRCLNGKVKTAYGYKWEFLKCG